MQLEVRHQNRFKMNQQANETKRPNRSSYKLSHIFKGLVTLQVLFNSVKSVASQQLKSPNLRDVSNLQLYPELRTVRLTWTYKHDGASKPTAFIIRYCELTSWDDEIKCRNNNLRVDNSSVPINETSSIEANLVQQSQNATKSLTVITPEKMMIRESAPISSSKPNESSYETQIFDLRAQTNYTFQVHVSQFSDERDPSKLAKPMSHSLSIASSRYRVPNGRRLADRDKDESTLNSIDQRSSALFHRIETKSFNAEATRCLANTSEVVINTGRYFGGRISVENSSDPRCQLRGDRLSDRATYLFRIDHELCKSKIVDKNKIESIVLVHENKDILTHNTARFHVLCHFPQKSFTLRASVALPKVDGLMVSAASRAAMITHLPGKPITSADDWISLSDNSTQSVRLGSMPGFYRAKSHSSDFAGSSNQLAPQTARDNANAIDPGSKPTLALIDPQNYQSGGLGKGGADDTSALKVLGHRPQTAAHRARSLALVDDDTNTNTKRRLISAPEPVQVQSQVLYIEGANSARVGRQSSMDRDSTRRRTPRLESITSDGEMAASSLLPPPSDKIESIVMSDNHRISDDYRPLSSMKIDRGDEIVRYSGSSVNPSVMLPGLDGRRSRSRESRMWSTDESSVSKDTIPIIHPEVNSSRRLAGLNNESSDDTSKQFSIFNQTIAQNLTGQFLKFSLWTLGNMARKTVDFLRRGSFQGISSSVNGTDSDDSELDEEVTEVPLVERTQNGNSSLIEGAQTTQFSLGSQISTVTEKVQTTAMMTVRPILKSQSPDESSEKGLNSNIRDEKPSRLNESLSDGFITSTRGQSIYPEGKTASNPPDDISSATTFQQQVKNLNLTSRTPPDIETTSQPRTRSLGPAQRSIHDNQSKGWTQVKELRDPSRPFAYWQIISVFSLAFAVSMLMLAAWYISMRKHLGISDDNSIATDTVKPNRVDVGFLRSSSEDDHCSFLDRRTQAKIFPEAPFQQYSHYDRLENCSNSIDTCRASCSLSTPSNGSTAISSHRESECKNNELLLSSHILINLNSNPGESHA